MTFAAGKHNAGRIRSLSRLMGDGTRLGRYNSPAFTMCLKRMRGYSPTILMIFFLLGLFSSQTIADNEANRTAPVTPEVVQPGAPEPAVLDSAAEKGAETWETTKEISKEAWEATKQTSKEVWDETKEVSQEVWDATKSGARKTGEYADRAWEKTKEVSEEAWDATTEAAGAAGRATKEAYEGVVGHEDQPTK